MTLSQVFKSRLLSNIWNQFLLYGFSSIIPILLIPYLLNVIGVEKYGLVNFDLLVKTGAETPQKQENATL